MSSDAQRRRASRLALGLLVLGLAQMAGDLLGIRALRALAAATTASPAPRVFSTTQGLEAFSTRFSLHWHDPAGHPRSLVLTPELNARLLGPYNRRNVYGAVLAFGTLHTPETERMFRHVARYALCGDASLLRELGLDPAQVRDPFEVRLTPLGGLPPPAAQTRWERPCRP